MNRSDAGLLAIVPLLLYTVLQGGQAFSPWTLAEALGLLATVAPVVGFFRKELSVLSGLPGLFLLAELFVVSGIAVNALPGALGELEGGAIVGAPIFLALAAASATNQPGRRALLLSLTLLTAGAVLAVASLGHFADGGTFANAVAQVPRAQATAIGAILAGGGSGSAPFISVATPTFTLLVLLAGAGGLSSLIAVDPEERPEALGFEQVLPPVPEGRFRSLLPEGRTRLQEASVPDHPKSADPSTLGSVVVAAMAAVVALIVAGTAPNLLVQVTAGMTIALLSAALLTVRLRSNAAGPSASASVPPAADPHAASSTQPI